MLGKQLFSFTWLIWNKENMGMKIFPRDEQKYKIKNISISSENKESISSE